MTHHVDAGKVLGGLQPANVGVCVRQEEEPDLLFRSRGVVGLGSWERQASVVGNVWPRAEVGCGVAIV